MPAQPAAAAAAPAAAALALAAAALAAAAAALAAAALAAALLASASLPSLVFLRLHVPRLVRQENGDGLPGSVHPERRLRRDDTL